MNNRRLSYSLQTLKKQSSINWKKKKQGWASGKKTNAEK
jgi:hypothetical protein